MLPSIFHENLFDDWFDDAFEKNFFGERNPLYGKHAKNMMKTDVRETRDSYKLAIDLPGFKKDEVKVELKDGYLTVSASKGLDKDEEDREGRFIRQERYAGACPRSFYVGDIRPEEVKCKYEFGVLRVTLPKPTARVVESPSHIAID